MRLALLWIAGLMVGCGRSDLLAGYEALPVADGATDITRGGEEAGPRDGAGPGPEDGAIDAPPGDSSMVADADADASPTELADGACGPGTCDGCCREDGFCVVRRSASAAFCGSEGHGCISCPPGITCGVDTSDGTLVCAHFL